jgi:hypothetical protein
MMIKICKSLSILLPLHILKYYKKFLIIEDTICYQYHTNEE